MGKIGGLEIFLTVVAAILIGAVALKLVKRWRL